MACEENTIQLPINIKSGDAKQYSRNLSQFLYDFTSANSITIMQMSSKLRGAFYMILPNISNSYINFTTLGNLQYQGSIVLMQSLNYFNGSKKPMEIIHIFMSKNTSEFLLMFTPVKVASGNSSSTTFFNSFVPLLKKTKEQNNNFSQTVNIQGLNLNNIIPRSHFMYYNAAVPLLGGDCTKKVKLIIYDKPIDINRKDYENFKSIFGLYDTNDLTSTETNPRKNLKNYVPKHTINYKMMYFNKEGTKRGPGKHNSDDIKELTCTPILDEEDKPIEGTRLDWIKQGFEKGVSAELKNLLFIIILVAVVVGVIVTVHEFVFKNLGKLVGDDNIVARSKDNL